MSFRSVESRDDNREHVINRFINNGKSGIPSELRHDSILALDRLIQEYGPAVDSYPIWHPLVDTGNGMNDSQTPEGSKWEGLDHTFYLLSAFVTCPYVSGVEKVLNECAKKKMEAKQFSCDHRLSVKKIDAKFWNGSTTAYVVCANGLDHHCSGIEHRQALRLMINQLMTSARDAHCGETWESMRTSLLGTPCGSRSSLFVDERTGGAMKKIHEAMTYGGLYGPVKTI